MKFDFIISIENCYLALNILYAGCMVPVLKLHPNKQKARMNPSYSASFPIYQPIRKYSTLLCKYQKLYKEYSVD